MNLILIAIIYFGYLLLWGLVCLLSFCLALIFKKPAIVHAVSGFSQIVIYILDLIIGGWLLIYTISLLINGQFLWFFIMIFIGIGIVTWLLSLIQMPFMAIPVYFAFQIDKIENEPDVARAEVLDNNHHVVATIEAEKDVDRRLAIYFMATYGFNLLSLILNASDYPNYTRTDFILVPFLWTLSAVVGLGLVVGVYKKLTNGSFFYPRKKIFLIEVLKLATIILVALTILFLMSGVWSI